jgi:hypothetical protein
MPTNMNSMLRHQPKALPLEHEEEHEPRINCEEPAVHENNSAHHAPVFHSFMQAASVFVEMNRSAKGLDAGKKSGE